MTDSIPSRETCLTLMDQHGMLPQIKAHSLQVARVALCLGQNLIPHYPDLDLALIEAGALLHDIAKTECVKTKGNHVLEGEGMVRAMGYDRVARIVALHVRLEDEYYLNGKLDEPVLVHYADKRVLHDQVVDLEERFDYLLQTYGRSEDITSRIKALYQETLKLEKKIFLHLPFLTPSRQRSSFLKSPVGMIEIKKNIYLVPGKNKSRLPYCGCLYIKGKDLRLLIDAGMGQANMEPCLQEGVDVVILSHCHIDHRLTLSRFPQFPIWCHETETAYLEDRRLFLTGIGLLRGGLDYDLLFKGFQIQEFSVQRKLVDGERINLGGISLQVLHTPGHTPGHLSFYIPEAELLFAADINLNTFGPFYGHDFSDISDFIESIRRLKALPAQTVVSSHGGTFHDHLDWRFSAYENIIYQRDRGLLQHLDRPRRFSSFLGKNLIYPRYLKPEALNKWFEQVHLEKQLKRLIEMGLVVEEKGWFRKIEP